jgi:hypothetical protein
MGPYGKQDVLWWTIVSRSDPEIERAVTPWEDQSMNGVHTGRNHLPKVLLPITAGRICKYVKMVWP